MQYSEGESMGVRRVYCHKCYLTAGDHLASACWRASYTSASIPAATFSSSDPLPAATFLASARLARTACKTRQKTRVRLGNQTQQTYLDGEVFQRCSLNNIDCELVVGVDGGKTGGNWYDRGYEKGVNLE